jgi:hypothetical protein
MQLVGFAMWGLLFTSLDNGLGKSFALLHDAEVPKMQQVSRHNCHVECAKTSGCY